MIKMKTKRNWVPKVTGLTCTIPWENAYNDAEDVGRAVKESCTGPSSSSINAFVLFVKPTD